MTISVAAGEQQGPAWWAPRLLRADAPTTADRPGDARHAAPPGAAVEAERSIALSQSPATEK